jgi:hypothetical protein
MVKEVVLRRSLARSLSSARALMQTKPNDRPGHSQFSHFSAARGPLAFITRASLFVSIIAIMRAFKIPRHRARPDLLLHCAREVKSPDEAEAI